jgi:anaerobic ribonucleoside-triphosphate reductase activating protein
MAAAVQVSLTLDIHGLIERSAANGPGPRSVLWTQGCSLGCAGCFNPATHGAGGARRSVSGLIDWVVGNDVEGLTVSGGEPLEQADAVLELCRGCRKIGLSVVLLTGFSWRYLCRRRPQLVADLRDCTDVVIAGRYSQPQHLGAGLRGSSNKTVELLTDRYTRQQIDDIPAAEIIINADGTVVVTGVDPVGFERTA